MIWNTDPRPAPPLMVDKMVASTDPLNPYPTLDIYARRTTSPHREVLASMEDPPKIKPGKPKGGGWGAGS